MVDMLRAERLRRITKAEDAAREVRNALKRGGVTGERYDLGGYVVRLADAVTQLAQATREML